ncbi:MAG: hypothetical protein A2Y51_02315 [Gallionellales bacterium RIFCSPLOWO2_02_60_31]|nr:MAG: hypothetical protein A2Y51_02315 [Gallionellales bacterium RIFCSPLOWO2_02_60_31]
MLHGRRIAHVQRVAENLIGEFCGEGLQQLAAPGEGGDDGAALKIMARKRQTQAARRTGYDNLHALINAGVKTGSGVELKAEPLVFLDPRS